MITTFGEFELMCLCVGAKCDCRSAYDQLLSQYAEPHRAYHDLRHIDFCLKEFFKVRNRPAMKGLLIKDYARGLCEHPCVVEAAIWYHDAVYDTHAVATAGGGDNEERSADFAITSLKLQGGAATILRELILDTRHAQTPATIDGRVLADIDLAGLGKSYEDFMADGQKIRTEYSWVDDDAFRNGRIYLLTNMLRRPTIYYTPMFQRAYEKQAQFNLREAVLDLQKR